MRFLLLILFCCTSWLAVAAEPMRFVYPPPEAQGDTRFVYYWDLLSAALEANRSQYGDFEIHSHPIAMNNLRAQTELIAGGGNSVSIIVRAVNPELEKTLRPIRIPLDKGLLGYRLFLIMPQMQNQLYRVKSLADLQSFSVGQVGSWVDSSILESAGFTVIRSTNYDGLFRMLQMNRFDLLCRGINEIYGEWQQNLSRIPDLKIESSLLLYYPLPRYFYVARTPQGELQAKRIEDGLMRLMRSGQFERRYQEYKKNALKGINLKGRKIFRIENPTVSFPIPQSDRHWWDDLSAELSSSASKQKH